MHRRHPAESEENPSMKKGNLDAFFEEKGLTENSSDHPAQSITTLPPYSSKGGA